MGNTCCVCSAKISNNVVIDYLSSWPGSILTWSKEDLDMFASCFTPNKIPAGEEISVKDPKLFFIVADGSIEIQAVLPTYNKKTEHVRQFLCKKDKGDMVYMPSIRNLITHSQEQSYAMREQSMISKQKNLMHKTDIITLVDTVSIKSISNSIVLRLDWKKFNNDFTSHTQTHEQSEIDVSMLRAIMETNLTEYLEKVPIFSEIPYSKLETFVRLCRYSVKKSGDIICNEGDMGNEVYVILKGNVKVEAKATERVIEILNSIENSNDDSSDTYGSGKHIVPAKYIQKMRKSSVKDQSISNVQDEWILKRKTMIRASCIHRKDCIKISSYASWANWKDRVKHVELALLGPGNYFGEISALIDLPRVASVTATNGVLMASLSNVQFRTLYQTISPGLVSDIEYIAKKNMVEHLFMLRSPFVQQLPTKKIHEIARNVEIKKFDTTHTICKEGDKADSFYFVYSGILEISQKVNDRLVTIGELSAGDYFGESSLFESNRLKTITAKTNSILLEITRSQFQECFADMPECISEFILRMKGRNADLTSVLNHSYAKSVFFDFLSQQHGQENILFFDDANDYVQGYYHTTDNNLEKEKNRKRALSIINIYITHGASNEVNVSNDMYKKVKERIDANDITEDIFEEAKMEIFKILETDCFPRFKNSAMFSSIMEKIRVYDDTDMKLLT